VAIIPHHITANGQRAPKDHGDHAPQRQHMPYLHRCLTLFDSELANHEPIPSESQTISFFHGPSLKRQYILLQMINAPKRSPGQYCRLHAYYLSLFSS